MEKKEFIKFLFEGFAALIFLACLLFGWYFIHKAKVKERLLYFEKGIDINNLINKEAPKSNAWLKIGIVITCAVFGLLFGLWLFTNYAILFFFLFAGIGMIIAHFVDRPKAEK